MKKQFVLFIALTALAVPMATQTNKTAPATPAKAAPCCGETIVAPAKN